MRSTPAPDVRTPIQPKEEPLLYEQMANSAVTDLGAEPLYVHHENYGAMLIVVSRWLRLHGHHLAAVDLLVAAEQATAGR